MKLLALMAIACAGCFLKPPPEEPWIHDGKPETKGHAPPAIEAPADVKVSMTEMRESDATSPGFARFPPKYYWVATPEWKNEGQKFHITRRHTSKAVIIRAERIPPRHGEKWNDLCLYGPYVLRQDAANFEGTEFEPEAKPLRDFGAQSVELDCAEYDGLKDMFPVE